MPRFRLPIFRVVISLLFIHWMPVTNYAAEAIRLWTDKTGAFRTEARFLSRGNGEVELQKPDGTRLRVPMEKLSKADQEYVAAIKQPSRLSATELDLCQKISHNYVHLGKFHEHSLEPDQIAILANSPNKAVARVAQLSLEEIYIRALKAGNAEVFEKYSQLFGAKVVLSGAAQGFQDFLSELSGREVSSLDSTRSAMRAMNSDFKAGVRQFNRLLLLEKRSLNLIVEQQRGLRELMAKKAAPMPPAGVSPLGVTYKLESPYGLAAATNRSKDVWHNCVVITYTDCRYVPNPQEEAGHLVLGALGEALTGLDMSESRAQDQIRRELRDIDRCLFAFVPLWRPGETVELPVGGYGTLLSAAQKVGVSVWSDETTVVDHPLALPALKSKIQAEIEQKRAKMAAPQPRAKRRP